jgi:hypothetical protein
VLSKATEQRLPEEIKSGISFGVADTVAVRLTPNPGQQRILGEAADFLRTRQPRSGVTAGAW